MFRWRLSLLTDNFGDRQQWGLAREKQPSAPAIVKVLRSFPKQTQMVKPPKNKLSTDLEPKRWAADTDHPVFLLADSGDSDGKLKLREFS